MPPKAPKAPITCNWMRSNVTDDTLADFVKTGYLPKKEIMSYRAPDPSEERPQPRDGEVVIFADHMSRGFAPPGSKFFRDVLNFFDLRPQDIGPNSVSNICNFQLFCEVYLGEEPSLLLFRELFYLNRRFSFCRRLHLSQCHPKLSRHPSRATGWDPMSPTTP